MERIGIAFGEYVIAVWKANGDRRELENSADLCAEAIKEFLLSVLELVIMLVAAWGVGRAMGALAKTKFGKKLGSEKLLEWVNRRSRYETTKSTFGKRDSSIHELTTLEAEARRLAELSKDPQTGRVNPKSRSEAQTILQVEKKGLLKKAHRPDLSNGEPNLDFIVEGGYADVKTPIKPEYRSLQLQATDIATKTKYYSSDIMVIIDMKNLSAAEKAAFKDLLITKEANMNIIKFLNN